LSGRVPDPTVRVPLNVTPQRSGEQALAQGEFQLPVGLHQTLGIVVAIAFFHVLFVGVPHGAYHLGGVPWLAPVLAYTATVPRIARRLYIGIAGSDLSPNAGVALLHQAARFAALEARPPWIGDHHRQRLAGKELPGLRGVAGQKYGE